MSATLDRTTFRTSRLLEFCSRKELVAQTGHRPDAWPLVILKELVDNALDACEETGVDPEISVQVNDDGITVGDNGPGLPEKTILGVLDFSVRVSSREAYVAPDRGAQGNALKTIVAMPFALDGERGQIEIRTAGKRHSIEMRVDRIRQEPIVDHQVEADADAANGTSLTVRWPDSPRSEPADADEQFLQDETEDPDENWADQQDEVADSPWSILRGAKSRFLQFADDYTWLNPHVSLKVDWFAERSEILATTPSWPKWKPSNPTSAHWYSQEHLERLIAGYIAHHADRGRDPLIRELVREFRGLTGTAKQKAVLEATGLARTKLSALVSGDRLDSDTIARLLSATKEYSKPVNPSALGLIGKDHLRARMEAVGCVMDTFNYRKVIDESDDIPWVVETAFGWLGDKAPPERRLITGVNWSPGILNPFRELGELGESLDSVLQEQRAGRHEPVVLVLHMACPRVEYTDRGKSAVAISK